MESDFPVLLRLPRPDHAAEEAAFVLLHVEKVEKQGRQPLDLKLIGTENETVFSVSLENGQTSSHKDPKSKLTNGQWHAVLSYVLLGIAPDGEDTAFVQGVEAVARLESGGTRLAITIQRRVEGITQRFGTITLRATEEEELDIFEWCGSALASKDKAAEQVRALKLSLREKDEQIKKLQESFAELTNLKTAHEKSLLEKFSLLLNEKKLKIRDQQRLLASSKVDPAKLKTLEANRSESRSRSAGPSRKGKRKAETPQESESDDEFEKMDVDKKEPDSEDEDRRTPDAETTADETESDNEAPPPPPVSFPTRKNANTSGKGTGGASSSEDDGPPPPPPPKQKLTLRKAPPSPKPVLEGSETESGDDEL
ncbi:hypothetical protein LSUE1_G008239 [Lachnellula suecica]|uniref:Uncharacterized protein n=1 Tax=Lachnellula suecica TaxID=602035 RepID=A0A8T9C1Q6_9HELO|nr:hypothetical protein LSUE1_G008239 [Lachnellula suecica]